MQSSPGHQFPTTQLLKFLNGRKVNPEIELRIAQGEIKFFCQMYLWWSKQSDKESLEKLLAGDVDTLKEAFKKYKEYTHAEWLRTKDGKYLSMGASMLNATFPDKKFKEWVSKLETLYNEEAAINRMERKTHWRNLGFRALNTFVIYAVIIATSFAAHHWLGVDLALVKFK